MLNTITTLYWDVHTLCFQRTIMYTAAFDLQEAFSGGWQEQLLLSGMWKQLGKVR